MSDSFIRSDGVKIDLIPEPYCKWCNKPIHKKYRDRGLCYDCNIKHPLIKIRAVGIYPLHHPRSNQLGKEIWQLKNGDRSMADKLGECMVYAINNRYQYLKDVDIIVPVPQGDLERGYNQAALLARYVSENISIPCKDILYKREESPLQHNITSLREKENAIQSKIVCREEITGKKVLLIDDVYVTGNTKNECVRALKDCGAGDIVGLVIGRSVDRSHMNSIGSSGGNYEQ